MAARRPGCKHRPNIWEVPADGQDWRPCSPVEYEGPESRGRCHGGNRLAPTAALAIGGGDDRSSCAGNAHRAHCGQRRAAAGGQEKEGRREGRGRREQEDVWQGRDIPAARNEEGQGVVASCRAGRPCERILMPRAVPSARCTRESTGRKTPSTATRRTVGGGLPLRSRSAGAGPTTGSRLPRIRRCRSVCAAVRPSDGVRERRSVRARRCIALRIGLLSQAACQRRGLRTPRSVRKAATKAFDGATSIPRRARTDQRIDSTEPSPRARRHSPT